MIKTLSQRLERFEGQPIKIFTDDRRVFTGILLEVDCETLRAIDKCGRLFFFELCHIDAIEEPQMELRHCHTCTNNDDEFEGFEGCEGTCGRVGCRS